MIYLDNAATTQLDNEAYEEMLKVMNDYGNASQPYLFSKKNKIALKKARGIIAKCINANPDEIYFTSGGSESDNWAIKCFGLTTDIKHIITTKIEHHAILNSCEEVIGPKCDVKYLNVDNNGIVDVNELNLFLNKERDSIASCENTLVSIMLANNEIGTIQPIKELANIAHKAGAYFHTDAVQAVGHINIDVKELGVDMLSASAHKFNGPKGIGFLYIKKGTLIRPLINGGSQENGMRAGTENVSLITAMAKALSNNIENLESNTQKLLIMENTFLNELNSYNIDYIRNGFIDHLPGLVNISVKNANGESILHRMDLMGCCISTGSACDSINNQVSHVIKAIHVPEDYAEGTIRISFGKNNSLTDPFEAAKMLNKIIKN